MSIQFQREEGGLQHPLVSATRHITDRPEMLAVLRELAGIVLNSPRSRKVNFGRAANIFLLLPDNHDHNTIANYGESYPSQSPLPHSQSCFLESLPRA